MAVATYFLLLFPNVMPTHAQPGLRRSPSTNASSTPYTLKIMTVVALVFTPLVLLYQGWTYWVFRKRIGTQHIPAAVRSPADAVALMRPFDPQLLRAAPAARRPVAALAVVGVLQGVATIGDGLRARRPRRGVVDGLPLGRRAAGSWRFSPCGRRWPGWASAPPPGPGSA